MSIRDKYLWDEVVYNEHGCKLDVWASGTPVNAPVLVFVPGGAWLWGDRRFQGYSLMSHLCDRGFICASVGYRTGVRRWPDQLDDVRDAWDWCDANLVKYGASGFQAIGGASAGAHMAALLGLEFSVGAPDAVVCLYGAFDWTSTRLDHQVINQYVRRVIVGKDRRSSAYGNASPIHRVRDGAPPTVLVHGTVDALTPISGARAFERKLASVGATVKLHEIKGAGHAFDLLGGQKAEAMADAVYDFLTSAWVESEWEQAQ